MRLHMHPLQQNLKDRWDFNWRHRHHMIPLSSQAREELLWWSSLEVSAEDSHYVYHPRISSSSQMHATKDGEPTWVP